MHTSNPDRNVLERDSLTTTKRSAGGTNRPSTSAVKKWVTIGIVAAILLVPGSWFIIDIATKHDVPDLTGMDYASAETLVHESGLTLRTEDDTAIEKTSGKFFTIVAQTPKPGSRIPSEADVTVTLQAQETFVPDLLGQTLAQAEKELELSGLFVDRVTAVPGNLGKKALETVSMWRVTDQSIPADKELNAGTGLIVSLEIPEVVIPDLVSVSKAPAGLDQAQAAFEENITDQFSRALLSPTITGTGYAPLSMVPAAGETVPAFTEVTITLGVPMPDIVGESLSASEAVKSLKDFGFTDVSRGHGDETTVVSQNIAAETIISLDTAIVLENKPKGFVYRVFGNGSMADITWSQPGSHSTQQANETLLPWEKSFDPAMSGRGYLSAFMLYENGTEITCQVLKDGVVVKERTSTGPSAMVTCD